MGIPEDVNRWEAVEGSLFPDGVSWVEEEQAYNFALYSEHAESVTLLLYGVDLVEPVVARKLDQLKNKSGRIWHCRIPAVEMEGALYYAYSIDGAPEAGGSVGRHRFDSEKILLDPYARSVLFPESFDRNAAIGPGSNAGKAPLGAIHACRSSSTGASIVRLGMTGTPSFMSCTSRDSPKTPTRGSRPSFEAPISVWSKNSRT